MDISYLWRLTHWYYRKWQGNVVWLETSSPYTKLLIVMHTDLQSWSQVGTRCEAFRIAHRKCGRRSSSQWYSPTDTGRSKLYSHTQLWIVATLQHTTTHCNRLQHRTCLIRRHTDISYHMFPLGFLYCSVPRVMRDTTYSHVTFTDISYPSKCSPHLYETYSSSQENVVTLIRMCGTWWNTCVPCRYSCVERDIFTRESYSSSQDNVVSLITLGTLQYKKPKGNMWKSFSNVVSLITLGTPHYKRPKGNMWKCSVTHHLLHTSLFHPLLTALWET